MSDLDQNALKAVPVTDGLVSYIARWGGLCRECADHDGVCPRSGLPCGGKEAAIKHVLAALNYGIANGYIAALPSPPDYAELVERLPTDEMVERGAGVLPRVWPGGFEDQTVRPFGYRPNDHARRVAREVLIAAFAGEGGGASKLGKAVQVSELVDRLRKPVDWAHFVSDDHAEDYAAERHDAAEAIRALSTRPSREDGLEDAARLAYRACMSAWSCGEPHHRVMTMLDAVDALGVALNEPGAGSTLALKGGHNAG